MSQGFEERDRLIAAAQAAFAEGRVEDARSFADNAAAIDPEIQALAGALRARREDPQGAIRVLTAALRENPNSFETLIALASLHREVGEIERAAELGFQAIRLRPNLGMAHFEFGMTWLAAKQFDRAVVALTRAAEYQPDFVPALRMLGKTWQALENHPEAAKAYRRAADLAPTLETLLGLAKSLNKLSEFEAAEAAARRAVSLQEGSSAAHLALAAALFGLERKDDARRHLARAIELDHEGAEAFSIGLVQRTAGDVPGSNESFRRAIAHDPLQPQPYAVLVHNTKITEADRPLVDKMRTLTQSPHVSLADKGGLRYGLGKALEDLGEYREAMLEYDEANRIARKTKLNDAPIDLADIRLRVDLMIRMAAPPAFANPPAGREESELPVLIVGMMRSGTTLAEQILSSHPEVSAAGEHPFWMKNWQRAFSNASAGYDPDVLAALGREYVQELRRLWPAASRVTDKTPSNFTVAGLVHLALPNARIIHLRRNPCDNALSIWTTPNTPVSDGGHDKANLVAVFQEYFRLMEHMRQVLPPERFLEVSYEDLVTEQEGVTREMVAFCGLAWDDACLRPELNPRPVLTPSMWQVRQPVYTSSIGRWRKFEPWLGPFSELLDIRKPIDSKAVASTASLLEQAKAAIERQRYSDAERILRQAARQERDNAAVQELLASVLKVLGRFDEASDLFESALRLDPARKGLLYDVATCRRVGPNDVALVERLQRALHEGPGSGEELIRVHFGLGKAYEDLGRYEDAMRQFEAGHEVALSQLRAKNQEFNRAECQARFDAIIAAFTKERLQNAKGGSGSDLPLLIVGLVRSGTTLVEQIYACHSQVAAGGELTFWPENWRRVQAQGRGFDASAVKSVSEDYLRVLRSIDGRARRVTDKMPGNYLALGAIHASFPHARVVVCRRNLLDTAVSVYATPIQSAHTWIHRREDIVFFFRQYERLMDHWREVLPEESTFEVPYEQLAQEPEPTSKQLLRYAGLPWEDACLHPEAKQRAVTTPSQWQVRQPIYGTSVDRWRRYEPWLGELAELK